MGHYDENRRFDELRRNADVSSDVEAMMDAIRARREAEQVKLIDPYDSKIKMVKFEVQVPTTVLTHRALSGWSDSLVWVCDTMGAFDSSIPRALGKGELTVLHLTIEEVAEFIKQYPHPVGSFYVIAKHTEVVKLIIDNPHRHIVHLLTK